VTWKSKIDLEP